MDASGSHAAAPRLRFGMLSRAESLPAFWRDIRNARRDAGAMDAEYSQVRNRKATK